MILRPLRDIVPDKNKGNGPFVKIRWLILFLAIAGSGPGLTSAATISGSERFAWSEDAGWINLRPQYGGVTVYPDYLSGYAWHENLGWLKLGAVAGGPYLNTNATDWGVNRDQAGNLSGFAWSENCGWVNFSPSGGGVTIDPATGAFSGMAWAENSGWISFRSQPAAPVTYGVGLTSYMLSIVFAGTGGGTVSSSNPSFSCNIGCSKTLFEITQLSLSAEASQYSLPGSWAGCDSSSGADCGLTLDRDRTATVTFDENTSHRVRIYGQPPAYYPTFQDAYGNSVSGDTIQVWGVDLNESIACGNIADVKIRGGYDGPYLFQTGATTVGGLTVGRGSVIVERIVIR
jgi:hypothetical protein